MSLSVPLLAPGVGLALPSLAALPATVAHGGAELPGLRTLLEEAVRCGALRSRDLRRLLVAAESDAAGTLRWTLARLVGAQHLVPSAASVCLAINERHEVRFDFAIGQPDAVNFGAIQALAPRAVAWHRWVYQTIDATWSPLGFVYNYDAALAQMEQARDMAEDELEGLRADGTVDAAEVSAFAERVAHLQAIFHDATAAARDLARRGTATLPPDAPPEMGEVVRRGRAARRAAARLRRVLGAAPASMLADADADYAYDEGMPCWPIAVFDARTLVGDAFDQDAEYYYETDHAANIRLRFPVADRAAAQYMFAVARALGAFRRAASHFLRALDGASAAGERAEAARRARREIAKHRRERARQRPRDMARTQKAA